MRIFLTWVSSVSVKPAFCPIVPVIRVARGGGYLGQRGQGGKKGS